MDCPTHPSVSGSLAFYPCYATGFAYNLSPAILRSLAATATISAHDLQTLDILSSGAGGLDDPQGRGPRAVAAMPGLRSYSAGRSQVLQRLREQGIGLACGMGMRRWRVTTM